MRLPDILSFSYTLFKILKKGRIQKISKENPIVHNLLITLDLLKIFKDNSMIVKLLILGP
jgi:hypothetical protein